MSNIMNTLLFMALPLGVIAADPDRVKEFFNKTVETGQQISTAGDMRSISLMLDHHYLQKGRYPQEKNFSSWMDGAFKENQLKPLTEDHWGNSYVYQVAMKQKQYTLISLGADGVIDTEDDLKITGP